MAFKIVYTEIRRDLHNAVSTFIFSLFLGFILFFVSGVSTYLNKVFEPPKWNADLLILPKGISPEAAVMDFARGLPDGLIPLALFKTLLQQSAGSSVKVLGFIPYKDSDGKAEVALTDSGLKDFLDLKDKSLWSEINLTNLDLKRPQFQPAENYQTPEWHDQVLMGILAKGNSTEIAGLKNLIDRKTIAQAFYVDSEKSEMHAKLMQLKTGLYLCTGFVFFSTLLGLLLALKNMMAKRQTLELVLKELKFKPAILAKITLIQIVLFFVFPVALGCIFSSLSFELIQSFIFHL